MRRVWQTVRTLAERALVPSRLRVPALTVLSLAFPLVPAPASAGPIEAGYKDFRYGALATGSPTGEKPESKLWWNDGSWWGTLWDEAANRYEIHKFDEGNHTWSNTGVAIDTRSDSKGDALWSGTKLYVASHIYATPGGPASSSNSARLYRYSYDSGSETYSLDAGFPVNVNGSTSETLVLDRDTTGQLWVTWVENRRVMLNCSLGDDLTWGTPFELPVQGGDMDDDDISSIAKFGGSKIGVMWSNQLEGRVYFAVHQDADGDQTWQARETVLDEPGLAMADDHMNLNQACDFSGNLYAVTKTGLTGSANPLILFLKRDSAGNWTQTEFGSGSDDHTRPVLMIDAGSNTAYVFASAEVNGHDAVYMKSTSLFNPSFSSGLGTPFIKSATDFGINNPTSTKQCVNSAMGILVAASDKNTTYYYHNLVDLGSNGPTISSVAPNSGVVGETVTIFGTKLNWTQAVQFNGVAASFTVVSDNSIDAVVPAGATTGLVQVTTPVDSAVSPSSFVVIQTPVISSFTPPSGPPLTEVTVTGSGFAGTTLVEFGGVTSDSFLVVDDNEIRAIVPLLAPTGAVRVTNASGNGSSASSFVVEDTPVVVSLDPPGGIPGTSVTIDGTHFTGASSVTFDGIPASFAVVSDGRITATVPSGISTGPVVVTTSQGSGAGPDFLLYVTPSIAGVTPSFGFAGAEVVISGSGFLGAYEVAFAGVPASFVLESDGLIRTVVPVGAETGRIRVTNPAGFQDSFAVFSVAASGTIVTMPTHDAKIKTWSTKNYGQEVDLRIRNGEPDWLSFLKFNVIGVTGQVDFATLRMYVNNESDYGGAIHSVSNDYAGTSTPWEEDGIHWDNAPAVTGSPLDVVNNANTGTWVEWDVTAAIVADGTYSFALVSESSNSAYFSSAEGANPPELLVGVSDDGSPTVDSFSPLGGVIGTEVTITGTHLDTATLVTFGGVVSSGFTIDDSTQVRAYVPAGAHTGAIGITTPSGSGVSSEAFIVSAPPVISSFAPTTGPAGSEVTITGEFFDGSTNVTFANVSAAFVVDSDAQIRAIVPTGASAGKITVTNTVSTTASSGDFMPNTPPSSTTVYPVEDAHVKSSNPTTNYGNLGTIRVRGGDPVYDSYLKFDVSGVGGAVSQATLRLWATDGSSDAGAVYAVSNDYEGTTDPWDEDGLASGNAPAILGPPLATVGATTQGTWVELDVSSAVSGDGIYSFALHGTGTNSEYFSSKEGVNAPELLLEISPPPIIASFTPDTGPAGTDVVISGTGFVGTTSVTFGGVPSGLFTVDSPGQITARVPVGGIPGPIGVTTVSGGTASGSDFTVIAPPVLTSFAPSLAPVGANVQLFGSGLTWVDSVAFDSVAATLFTVDSDTSITATVPSGASSGPIHVSSPGGADSSATAFTLVVPPAIASFTPAAGPVGAVVQLFGSGFTGVTTVSFDTTAATLFTVDADTMITATVPDSAGSGPISVTNAAASAISDSSFAVIVPPSIASFSPALAPVGGAVQLFGSGFTGVSTVSFDSVAATLFTVDSDTSITATVPDSAGTGRIRIANVAGNAESATDFVLVVPPAMASFSPGWGPAGTPVQLLGTGFTGATSVTFDSVAATLFTVDSDTLVTATVPDSATSGVIELTNAAGSTVSTGDFLVGTMPGITSFAPASAAAGDSVQLFGTSFTTLVSVSFDSVAATLFTVDSDSVVTVTVPDSAVSGPITVGNDIGFAQSPTDFTFIHPPVVSGFAPPNGLPGSSLQLFGTGFTGVTEVAFDSLAATIFTVDADSQITVTVPDSAATGPVRVTNVAGSASTPADYVVVVPPSIASLVPPAAPIGGTISVFGSGLSGVTEVRFDSTAATLFTVDADTAITVTVPDGITEGPVHVTNAAGSATSSETFRIVVPPTLTSFSPGSGPEGSNVQLFGTGLVGVTEVLFDSTAATLFTVDSDSQVTATVPVGATSGPLTVTNASGVAATDSSFVVVVPPALTSFAPAEAAEGAAIQLFGTGFTGVTEVLFDSTAATLFTVDSDSVVTAAVPVGATDGLLTVTNAAGSSASADSFTVVRTPVIASFTPAEGPAGAAIHLFGTNFTGTTEVLFDSTAATLFVVDADSQITVAVPSGASSGPITVTNGAGSGTSGAPFTVIVPPVIASFAPGEGPAGTVVQLLGSGFSGVSEVLFDTTAATAFTVDADSAITVTVPLGAASGPIRATNAAGSAESFTDFTAIVAPIIASFAPASGPEGASVSLLGTGFTGVTEVLFDSTAATLFTVDSDTVITAAVPTGAGNGPITVTNAAGSVASDSSFTVILEPVIASFTPDQGPAGASVTLFGSGFTGVTEVLFDSTAATLFTVDSDTVVTATVPSGAGTGPITLTNAAGSAATATDFTEILGPSIVSFSPVLGPEGAIVSLFGASFTGVTEVLFDSTAATLFTVDSDSVVTATVPAGAGTGPITLTNAAGSGSSASPFTLVVAPTIVSFAPGDGPVGASVSIAGTGLTGVTEVLFDTTAATAFTVDADTLITATVPAGAASGAVTVTNAAGSAVSATSFTVILPPSIASFTPAEGPEGTGVTILGTGFTGVSEVLFDSTAAVFTVASDSTITTTVPAGAASGAITVTNSAASAVSAGAFTVIVPPSIASFSPVEGPEGVTVQLFGTGFTGVTAVLFDTTAATAFTVDSDTVVSATVPLGAPSGLLTVTNAAGTAVSASAFTVIVPPSITSFTPADGPAGTVVTLLGAGFTGVSEVLFDTTAATGFTVDSDSSIAVTVPAGATSGPVTVTNAAGGSASASAFTVILPPAIASFSPAEGLPGASVSILGTGFTGVTAVVFDTTAATVFTVDSDTEITATVPAGAATGVLTVTNAAGSSASATAFAVIVTPSIASFSPAEGPEGASVQLFGTGFTGVTEVLFDTTAATAFTVDSDTAVTATVPAGAGNGPITVTNPAGPAVSASPFTVILPPSIASFTPAGGPEGTGVTLFGTGFTGVSEVLFDSTAATVFTVDSDSTITAAVPAGAVSGPITVTNAAASAVSASSFVVLVTPSIASFSPLDGPVGTNVQLFGTGFTGVTEVLFDTTAATAFTVDADTLVTATVPAGAGNGPITVTNPAGSGVSASPFTVIVPPSITSFTPVDGPEGTVVTLLGTGLTGVSEVLFDTTAATAFTVDSDSSISATVPTGAASGPITVTNAAGSAASASAFTVTVPPTIASFSPGEGLPGASVSILGAGFTGVTEVAFDTTAATVFTVDSDAGITATVPAGAATGAITVTNSAGASSSASAFAVIMPPSIASFSPAEGPEGASVQLLGTGFTGVTEVLFDTTAATAFTVDADTLVTATVPAGAGNGPITVTNPAGSGASASPFTVILPPSIASFSPADGPAGTVVTLLGTGLTGVSEVLFDTTAATAFTVASDTSIEVTLPAGAASGPITATNAAGSAVSASAFTVIVPPAIASFSPGEGLPGASVSILGTGFTGVTGVAFDTTAVTVFTVDSDSAITATVPAGAASGPITVTNAAASGVSASAFAVIVTPSIASVTPADGPVGASIQLFGTGFTGVTEVLFDTTAATAFTVDSDTGVTATVPVGAGNGPITVTNPAGSGVSASAFTVIVPPSITSFSPAGGPEGTGVTLFGTGFTGVSEVLFDSTAATVFTVDSDSTITTTVPAEASNGPITVTNAAASFTSASDFTVLLPPSIASFSPGSGVVGTSVQILGSTMLGVSEVLFDTTAATVFTVDSDSQVTATVPVGATTGRIRLTNGVGSSESSTDFEVIVAPSIASFSPAEGPEGASVSLFGTGFTGVTEVLFDTTAATAFTVDSDTSISATVPAGAGSGPLAVTNAAGTVASASSFTVIVPPSVTSFAPGDGPEGTVVQVLGTGFTGVSGVSFGGVAASVFTVDSDSLVTVTVPAGGASGPIGVTNAAGVSASSTDFTVIVTPVVTSLSPGEGPVGTSVTIAGSGFTGTTGIDFGGAAVTVFTVDSDTTITATVPAGAATGAVTVTNAAGSGASATGFVVVVAPSIASFSPSAGPAGEVVQLFGSGFAGVSEVVFDSTAATIFSVDSDTTITATVPAGAGSGPITVTNAAGSVASAGAFTVIVSPSLASFSPANGPAGTAVQILGTDLTHVTSVLFGGVADSTFTVDSDSSITATVPAGAATGPVRVENAAGFSESATDFTVIVPPVVASFDPTSGPVGEVVQLSGTGFVGTSAVSFGGVAAITFSVDSDSTITATVPDGAATGAVAVTNAAGSGAGPVNFTVIPPPVIVSFSPGSGPVGVEVEIRGSGLANATSIRFDDAEADLGGPRADADTLITVTVPNDATSGLITVTTVAGVAQTATDFEVIAPPAIASFAPASGPEGTNVLVTGSSFTTATGVAIDTVACAFTVDSDSTITATVPAGAPSGLVSVTNAAGTAASATAFTGIVPPALASFAPGEGPVGTILQLLGTGFTGLTDVLFDGTAATSFTVDSDTVVTVTVPTGAGSGPITVTNAAGSVASATDFTVIVAPALASFTPVEGPIGTGVTLFGSGLTGVSEVLFGGTAAVAFTVDADSQVTATVPGGAASGLITVTNAAGSTASGASFTVIVPPVLASFTPDAGPEGTAVAIVGSGLTGVTEVAFAGTVAAFTVDSDSTITATVPAGAVTGSVTVTNAAGSSASASDFTVIVLPTIASFTPAEGPAGMSVSIAGTGLTGVSEVLFGGVAATVFTVDTDTTITATVPAGAASGVLTVTNAAGSAASATDFTVIVAPALASFTPAEGPAGTSVSIAGTGLTGVSEVLFGGVAATVFTVDTDSTVTATVPAGAASGAITVTNAAGSAASATDFTVIVAPALASFAPAEGPAGTIVSIAGTGLTGTSEVLVGGVAATVFTVDTDTTATATVPAGAASGPITVTNAAGSTASATDFTVIVAPALASFTPAEGPAGTIVSIAGTGLTGVSEVLFGGVAATVFTVDTDTTATATVPAGAASGAITVTNAAGSAASATDFTVVVMPTIAGFTPAEGPAGTSVSIAGTGLTGVSEVLFGGVAATVFTVDTDTTATATVPAGAASGAITVTNAAGSTASATDFTVIVPPTIAGFTPAEGPAGMSVSIAGTGLTGVSEVLFGGVAATVFTVDTDTTVTATVPAGAASGPVTVTNAAGSAASATDFMVIVAPALVSFTPAEGPAGMSVSIAGSGLTGVSEVLFGGVAATVFSVDTDTTITATVPAGAASGAITVTNAAGSAASATDFTVIVMPALASFTPAEGPAGTIVSIAGTGLTGVSEVLFGGVAATVFTVDTDTTATATVPSGAASGAITVTNAAGSTASATDFTVIVAPTIAGFTPAEGPAGMSVSIAGTGLTGVSEVLFGGVAATVFTVDTDTTATATVPAGAASGAITVTNAAGSAASATDFTVVVMPTIAGFAPAEGPAGTSVSIAGTGLTGVSEVLFGGVAATVFTVDTDTTVTATVPAGAASGAASGAITVTNAAGSAASATDFTVIVMPALASFAPAEGPAGTSVSIAGTGLTGVSEVLFGGVAATVFTVDTDTTATATVPAGAASGAITVTNAAGSTASATDFTVIVAPALASFTPAEGPAGTSVSIAGTGLTGVSEVLFGGVAATVFTVDTDSTVTATVPSGGASGPITVTNAAGSAASATDFTVIVMPALASFTPADGPAGTVVSIAGSGLTGVSEVLFGGVAATVFTVDTDTSVTATVPVGAASGPITLTNAAGSSASASDFTVIVAPALASFTPAEGPAGASVSIAGTGLTGVSEVLFGGIAATAFTVDTDTTITATVPAGAVSGPVTVTNAAGSSASASDFTVIVAPALASFAPAEGPAGTSVSIAGSGLTGVSEVLFGGVAATAFTVDTDTTITATVPAGAATGPLTVTNAAGSAVSATAFTVIVPPVIAWFAPAQGPAGTSVSIAGTGFTGTTEVLFGGLAATAFTVETDSTISVTVPAGAATGQIAVTNAAGSALAATDFTVIVTPAVSGFTPAEGPTGTSVSITGAGLTGVTDVRFGGVATTVFTVESDTTITATVPSGAVTGPILVTNAAGPALSANDFTVIVAPSIAGFAPSEGPVGTGVSVSGAGLTGVTEILFGGVAATAFTVVSDTLITTAVPSGAASGAVTATNAAGSAASATDFTVIVAPSIASFTPAEGPAGTSVSIAGAGFTGVTGVAFGGVAATVFTVDSDSTVTATVPAGAPSGPLTVTNAAGSSQSATDFTVIVAPSIAGLTPADGIVGTVVSIGGTGFPGVTEVLFGGVTATVFTVDTDTSITATVPAGAVTGPVAVTNAAGSSLSPTDFTVIVAPSLAGFAPAMGAEGANIFLSGSGFSGVTEIRFGGVVATAFTVDADTTITATVPAGAVTGPITVTNAAGSVASATNFTVVVPPVLSSFTPEQGPAGTSVTVLGSGFTGVYSVVFDSTAASFTVDSDSSITTTVPAGATTGPITVTNAAGAAVSGTAFAVGVPPSLTAFTPDCGPVGTTVTITGSDLTGASAVRFGGVAATVFTVDSDTQITADVPAGAVTGTIEVETPAGAGASVDVFCVATPPSVVTLTPSHDARVKSSKPSNNYGSADMLRVRFGSEPEYRSYLKFDASGIAGTVQSAKLRLWVTDASPQGGIVYKASNVLGPFEVPWGQSDLTWNKQPDFVGPAVDTLGSVIMSTWVEFDVTSVVTGPGVHSFGLVGTSTNSARYSSKEGTNPPELVIETGSANGPMIDSFSPGSGLAGTEVTLSGTGFTGATLVTFDGTVASFTVDGPTQIRATVPPGAATGPIAVTTPEGTGLSLGNFVITQPPVVTSISPTSGPPGSEVVILGSSLVGATDVTFGGVSASSFVVQSATRIDAIVPIGAVLGKVTVWNAAGSGASADDFTPTAPPSEITLAPTDDARVKDSSPSKNYGSDAILRARFGSPVTHLSYLKFDVAGLGGPVASATLRLRVTDGSNDGGGVFLVGNDYDGTSIPWSEDGVTWNNAPEITGAPLSSLGSVTTGEWVELDVTGSITGNGVYSFAIRNGSTNSAIYSSKEGLDAPELVIQVATAGNVLAGRDVELSPAPVLERFLPRSGKPGVEVRVHGRALGDVTEVLLGDVAVEFRVESPRKLVLIVPEHAPSGEIRIVSPGGEALSRDPFEVLTLPELPTSFELAPGRPNPFRNATTIRFGLPERSHVELTLYNVAGRRVRRLEGGVLEAGFHEVVWDGRDTGGSRVASGVYLVVLETNGFRAQRKLTILK